MTMTDPIARHAYASAERELGIPRLRDDAGIEDQVAHRGDPPAGGLHHGLEGRGREVGKNLVLELKFGPNRERSIAGIKRISKPGLRVYAKSTNLPKVLGGLGVAIISTSHGLLTDKQAGKKGVGGEVLAYVW